MKFYIKTFGCQMNVNDSEKMRHILKEKGLTAAKNEIDADIVIINSCAVREKPQEKIFSFAGRVPAGKKVIVAGCVAQSEKENILKRGPRIDYVVGTHQYYKIGDIVDKMASPGLENSPSPEEDPKQKFCGGAGGSFSKEPPARRRQKKVSAEFTKEWQEKTPYVESRDSVVSGFISIMEGCDNFCSYCIVPFTRGREKHRPFAQIVKEAEYLAEAGYKEIILLGQNVNNWQDSGEGLKFPDLLARLAEHVPVKWLRFITSYPGYYDDELIAVLAEHRSVARHIHFPAQSGSTRILKKMNRIYTRPRYLKIIKDFKKKVPGMKFSADFIVGFPGETERDFRLTLSLIEQVEYESLFSFIYSPRKHTKAYKAADDIPLQVKKERLYRLQETQEKIQLRNNKKLVGREVEVLVTGVNPKKAGAVIGRTESYQVVNFVSDALPGEIRKVLVDNVGPYSLRGDVERLRRKRQRVSVFDSK
ncbi:MAG: MiaB/RimO family radical SAM methylthiotransferase [Candidatus Aminicenantes bacterium]|nr:MiaB/RimO family radical SAM methylthiotransferase [Candidatus Aminicenantes bacterium]